MGEDLKYKVGDKVRIKSLDWYNKNKDEDGDISCGEFDFVKGMKKFCSEVFTISENVGDGYLMLEDKHGYVWTDEMIECKVEEECPQDFIEKYCKSCGTQRCDRTKEFLDGCPYYNEYMCEKQNNDMKKEMSLDKAGQITDFEYEGLAYTLPDGYQFVDDNGNVINTTKIVLEKKKKEYPKTYEECCEIIGGLADYVWGGYKQDLFQTFHMLYICRDAYWKIAGEEMELGKPWENDRCEDVYGICRDYDDIVKQDDCWGGAHIFEFPTREMRDAFFNAFRDDIEKCKELI